MPKPRPTPPPPVVPPTSPLVRGGRAFAWSLCSWIAPALLPMLALLALLCCVLRLDQSARGELSARDRYRIAFTAVDCAPPPSMDREEFLGEVQYLARQPDDLCLLDEDITARLAAVFAQHPWVEQVQRVSLGPNHSIKVDLRYRTPVLAVRYGSRLRAVDAHGILLPFTAATSGLPVYNGVAEAPKGPSGTAWGDPAVLAAASNPARR